jgi:peptidoglycan/xylan/chitin deacetylase (PgdA/CDA1 family)
MWRKIALGSIFLVLVAGVGFLRMGKVVSIPILTYHQISENNNPMSVHPQTFEEQLQYLRSQGYTSVTLDEVVTYMQGNGVLPTKPIVITFDDGYVDNYTTAIPILRKYGYSGIIFVITDNIGKQGYLTWDQMKAMQERAISIGSHTMTHVDLTQLTPEEVAKEVGASKQALERGLGTPAEFFAYPYGRYSQQVIAALQAAGYKGACSGAVGVNTRQGNIYALQRIYINQPYFGIWEFKLRLLRAQLVMLIQ